MSWQQAVEKTVTGLGLELVECERSAGGLLRVTIDRIEPDALAKHGVHLAHVSNRRRRIARDEHQVGLFAGLQAANFVARTDNFGGINRYSF